MYGKEQDRKCKNLFNHLREVLRKSISSRMSDAIKCFQTLLQDAKVIVRSNRYKST